MKHLLFLLLSGFGFGASVIAQKTSNHGNKFEQLGYLLQDPNEYRSASGAPGPKYWQQRADYDIKCEIDEPNLTLNGSETITYFNNSPDPLTFLWLQLDENEHSATNNANYQDASNMPKMVNEQTMGRFEDNTQRLQGYGVNIIKMSDAKGKTLKYTINKTMVRVELPAVLKPGEQFIFNVSWNYKIPDRMSLGGRGGYEFFPEDGNHLFTMTQWYPRLCVYSDFQGWQNHQFTGRGEFALTFGNYKVQMTVPADHIIGSTGECQNLAQVLSATQLKRWQQAQTAKEPLEVVTLDEAKAAEKQKSKQKKTWIFRADNVRDFAWGSSRKFVWDAMPAYVEGKKIMCMSLYGKEAYGLYRKYSTKAVAHTIKTYSKYTIPYPYPVAQSVEAANGMEYPMICFNYGRTEKDGTYSAATKYGMLGVVIHEVGHNFFPMIINSDERQWSWMDEGLNTFVEYLTEEEWENNFPSRRGPAYTIADYMRLPKDQLEPIMTNSENIVQFGPNAYSKPATALNILRETIMGRENFDYAFKEYARRWAFKHPTPSDFFRTMEDASAVDLDWFWRGWFFGIEPVDIALDSVKTYVPEMDKSPVKAEVTMQQKATRPYEDISKIRNREEKKIKFAVDADTSLLDFYNTYRPWETEDSLQTFKNTQYYGSMEELEAAKARMTQFNPNAKIEVVPDADPLTTEARQKAVSGKYFYELYFNNKGGLVMPIIIEWTYKDGTKEVERIPAEIWRKNENNVTKLFVKNKEVTNIKLDPMRETADINEKNNNWPVQNNTPSKFQLFKQKAAGRGQSTGGNPMQKAQQKKGF
jgi:Peptidase family M1 domain